MSETYINLIAEELWANTLKRSVRYVTEEKYLLSQARITDLEAQLAHHTKIVEAARVMEENHKKLNALQQARCECPICKAFREEAP